MSDTLKPCPFCGGRPEAEYNGGEIGNKWGIRCDDCGVYLPAHGLFVSEECAILAWNKRSEVRG